LVEKGRVLTLSSFPRIFAVALACAALYAAILGAGAVAQEEPTPSPEATSTATATVESSPVSTLEETIAPPAEPSTSPAGTPEGTPESTPTEAPTTEPSPFASPVETVLSADPTATGTPTQEPTAEATPAEVAVDESADEPAEDDPNAAAGIGTIADPNCRKHDEDHVGEKDSPSSEGRECKKDKVVKIEKDIRRPDGAPTIENPAFTLAHPGAVAIGVPNFMIEKFRIPPFLLPIYQAAGIEYGVRWEVLAAINEIETDYGRNLNVSSAGALGWMQFMPPTWEAYGTDANKDGVKDPYNPVDAIFAAARYLKAAGADTDLYKAIFAYNHADWYVDSVLMRARVIGGLPSNFVGSLTGLTQARFPVHARATYADDLDERNATRKIRKGANAAFLVESQADRRGIRIFSESGAPVVAVNDGKVVNIGTSKRLGRFVQLQDVYGNTFTYAHLAKVATTYPAAKQRHVTKAQVTREMELPAADPKPTAAASSAKTARKRSAKTADKVQLPAAVPAKTRLYANPARPEARSAGGELQLAAEDYKPQKGAPLQLNQRDFEPKRMREGSRIIAGTILGRIGKTSARQAPHMLFEIRPAGRGAPRIDPKPILDGWKLLENTAIYRAAGKNPFFGEDAEQPSIGQILLMSKEALAERVLSNPRVDIYGCGRADVRAGQIDRRVLATLEFLAASGVRPTVTSLRCGHGVYTSSGNVSHHSSGNAVDIAAVNGIPIIGNQGKGSITDIAVQRLLTLQGTMKPDQIITLMTYEGADNTYAMADHHDHIHVGWRPLYGTDSKAAKQVNAVLKPQQWIKLIDRLKEIDNPHVRLSPSKYAVKVERASRAHVGE
jgi:hypothetical protein